VRVGSGCGVCGIWLCPLPTTRRQSPPPRFNSTTAARALDQPMLVPHAVYIRGAARACMDVCGSPRPRRSSLPYGRWSHWYVPRCSRVCYCILMPSAVDLLRWRLSEGLPSTQTSPPARSAMVMAVRWCLCRHLFPWWRMTGGHQGGWTLLPVSVEGRHSSVGGRV